MTKCFNQSINHSVDQIMHRSNNNAQHVQQKTVLDQLITTAY